MQEMKLAIMTDQDNYNSNQCFLQLKNLKKNLDMRKESLKNQKKSKPNKKEKFIKDKSDGKS